MSSVGRTIAGWVGSMTAARRRTPGYHTFGRLQRAVEGEGGLASSLEAEARAVERAVGEAAEAEDLPIDPDQLAERIFQLFTKEIRLERERAG